MRPLYLFSTLKHSVFCRPAVRQASPWTLEALEARLLLNADLAGVVQQLQLPGVQAVANTLGGVVNQVTNAVGNTVGALPQLQTQPHSSCWSSMLANRYAPSFFRRA